jgi:hypothetical protein
MLPMIRITMVHYSSTLFVTNTESGAVAHNNYNFEISWGAGANALGLETVARLGLIGTILKRHNK